MNFKRMGILPQLWATFKQGLCYAGHLFKKALVLLKHNAVDLSLHSCFAPDPVSNTGGTTDKQPGTLHQGKHV